MLEQRIATLERITGDLRRDLNRIDRKLYRGEESPAIVPKAAEDPIFERLWKCGV